MFERSRKGSLVLTLTALMLWPAFALAEGPIVIGVNGEGPKSREANIGWVRTGTYWKDIHTGVGQFNFGEVDRINDEAYARGQNVLMILSGAPKTLVTLQPVVSGRSTHFERCTRLTYECSSFGGTLT